LASEEIPTATPISAAGPHDRAARADTRDEGIGTKVVPLELPPDLRPRRAGVGVRVVLVRKLARQERLFQRGRILLGQPDAPQETAFLLGNEANLSSQAADEVLDAPRHVHVLGLGVEDIRPAVKCEINGQERRVAHPVPQIVQLLLEILVRVHDGAIILKPSGQATTAGRAAPRAIPEFDIRAAHFTIGKGGRAKP